MRARGSPNAKVFMLALLVFFVTIMVLKVQRNRSRLETQFFLEFDESTEPPPTMQACTQDLRKTIVKETCKLARKQTGKFGLRNENNLRIMVADDHRKILYCVMAKTGTKSWLHYLVTLAGKVRPGHWHFRKPDFMKRAGLHYRRNVPLSEISTKYKDYFKFIVARHPLQRLASAYYEAILKAERYNKNDGSAPNFTEFTGRLDKDLKPQLHWSLYQDECQICKVNYDFIIKTETIDEDTRRLNEAIGSDVNLTVRHTNFLYEDTAKNTMFKYDHMFQDVYDEHAPSLRTALRVYHNDMRSLGYQWNWNDRQSRCDNDDGRGGHCC